MKPNIEELWAIVIDTAYHLHVDLGPGLLESVYEAVLATQLEQKGLTVVRQKSLPVAFAGLVLDEGFRIDLLIDELLVVELKSVEIPAPVHYKQLLTYLRLARLPVGLLINFGSATFREGIKRIVNGHDNPAGSLLRVNQARFELGPDPGSREGAKSAKRAPD